MGFGSTSTSSCGLLRSIDVKVLEEFAWSADRAEVLKNLVPDSKESVILHLLQDQHERRSDHAEFVEKCNAALVRR